MDVEIRLLERVQSSLRAEDFIDEFKNVHEDPKMRYRDLIVLATGDFKLADKIYREMVNNEIDAKIDGQF